MGLCHSKKAKHPLEFKVQELIERNTFQEKRNIQLLKKLDTLVKLNKKEVHDISQKVQILESQKDELEAELDEMFGKFEQLQQLIHH